jgi:hypothetical protein
VKVNEISLRKPRFLLENDGPGESGYPLMYDLMPLGGAISTLLSRCSRAFVETF